MRPNLHKRKIERHKPQRDAQRPKIMLCALRCGLRCSILHLCRIGLPNSTNLRKRGTQCAQTKIRLYALRRGCGYAFTKVCRTRLNKALRFSNTPKKKVSRHLQLNFTSNTKRSFRIKFKKICFSRQKQPTSFASVNIGLLLFLFYYLCRNLETLINFGILLGEKYEFN